MMTNDKPRYIGKFIERLLHWLGSLISRKRSTARSGSNASKLSDTSATPISNSYSPTTPSAEAEQTSPPSGASPNEKQAPTVQASGEVATLTADAESSTPAQVSTDTQSDATSQLESPSEVRAESSTGDHQKTFDPMSHAQDESDLVVPGTETAAEAEPERQSEDGSKKPDDKAAKREGGTVPPGKRGGRPRSHSTPASEKKEAPQTPRSSPESRYRPEVICWKLTREWVVGIEIPDDILRSSDLNVLQNGRSLSESAEPPGCWPLAELDTPAKVVLEGKPIEIPLQGKKGLLFKLSGGLEQGRKVKQVSSGSYLAIVPDTWRRDEQKAGSPPTSPEPVFLKGYQAHFFDLTDSASSCVAFLDEHDWPVILGGRGPQFHLVGHKIPDESERLGPLFSGLPPRVKISNGSWADVSLIVVGQEGSGGGRWRKSFKPSSDRAEQELPQEILQRKVGWYFVRFYDSADTLIDSLVFRFVAGLKAISILTNDLVPSPDGHATGTVEISHEAGYRVTHSGKECPDLQVERETQRTILRITPRADCDLTRWLIRLQDDQERNVELTILVKRLWWALGAVNVKPSHWGDKPIQLSPEDLTATSNQAIWLRLPKPRLVAAVSAGFNQERSRKFPVRVTDNAVGIPLRDFSAAQELEYQGSEREFKVWFEIEGRTHHATVAVLPAQEDTEVLDVIAIPAHRLATLMTRLRRRTRGRTRLLIKEVRKEYRRQRRSQPARNCDFIKESLCLIAVLMEENRHERQLSSLLSERWKKRANLARREFPDLVHYLRGRAVGRHNGGSS